MDKFKCPSCHQRVSIFWLLFGTKFTKYNCRKCATPLQWTKQRNHVVLISGLMALAIPLLLRWLFASYIMSLPVIILCVGAVFLIAPKQFEKAEDYKPLN